MSLFQPDVAANFTSGAIERMPRYTLVGRSPGLSYVVKLLLYTRPLISAELSNWKSYSISLLLNYIPQSQPLGFN